MSGRRAAVRGTTAARPAVFRAIAAGAAVVEQLSRSARRPAAVPVDRALALCVSAVRSEAEDVVSLQLARPDGTSLPPWSPGDHIDLTLPSGRVRQYSLCGDPATKSSYRIAVRRIADGGGGSREVHALAPGARVTARGPRVAFPLIRAPRYLFLAGGIGITPILPMVCAAARAGVEWRLVYVGRSRRSMPFLDDLPAPVMVRADDEHGGPASGAELLAHAPGAGTHGYLCGPPPMLASVRAAWNREPNGLAALHVERFTAPPVLGGHPFTVELARSRLSVAVPADRSVLSVLDERVVGLAYSCRQGFCGTCRTRVLAGPVEHRDRALSEAERAEAMTICVSRAAGDHLVLDL